MKQKGFKTVKSKQKTLEHKVSDTVYKGGIERSHKPDILVMAVYPI